MGKEFTCNAGDSGDGFSPWVGKIPWFGKISWGRAWEPTPVFLPGESHGLRSLAATVQKGQKESDMPE